MRFAGKDEDVNELWLDGLVGDDMSATGSA